MGHQAKVKFVSSARKRDMRIFGECRLHSITRLLGVIWSSEEAHTVDAWQSEAMKDVVACDKLWGVGKQTVIQRSLNGGTHLG